VIDPAGQRVNAHDRLYLAAEMPSLIVWGGRDRIIPVRHGEAAHEAMPGSRLEILESGGHFPHNDDPDWFGDVLAKFMAETEPAAHDAKRIRAMLLQGSG
jgi:pimeloyl-ACP methyl ester carboxylesterase